MKLKLNSGLQIKTWTKSLVTMEREQGDKIRGLILPMVYFSVRSDLRFLFHFY